MIYLDSCLVIYLVESRTRADLVRARMSAAEDAHFAISPLVALECLVGPFRSEDEPLRLRYERVLDPMTVLTMGITVFERAARFVRRTGSAPLTHFIWPPRSSTGATSCGRTTTDSAGLRGASRGSSGVDATLIAGGASG